MVKAMDYWELLTVKKDLENGSVNMKKIIRHQIKERQKEHGKRCSVCSCDIAPDNHTSFTLLFGPEDFKKKGTFCAMDCLEYFISKLKNIDVQSQSSIVD